MGTGYNVDLDGPLSELSYNFTLIEAIKNFTSENPNMIKLKADSVAERSFNDNIDSMFKKNQAVIVAAFVFIFLYISLALGHFPSKVYMRFTIGLSSILVVAISFMSACGTTFYWGQSLTPLTADVVPIILLAVGLDSLFIVLDAEQKITPSSKK